MPTETTKPAYLSKTLWVNALLAVSALFVPSINEWVVVNPDSVAIVFTVVNFALRLITKDKISLG